MYHRKFVLFKILYVTEIRNSNLIDGFLLHISNSDDLCYITHKCIFQKGQQTFCHLDSDMWMTGGFVSKRNLLQTHTHTRTLFYLLQHTFLIHMYEEYIRFFYIHIIQLMVVTCTYIRVRMVNEAKKTVTNMHMWTLSIKRVTLQKRTRRKVKQNQIFKTFLRLQS